MRESIFPIRAKACLCFVALAVILPFALHVCAERLPVKTYTAADGLGSSSVSHLMLDSRGFLWFATRDGLSRFDGQRFITYRVGTTDAPPGIEHILETRDGVYWISTTGGIYRYDPRRAAPVAPTEQDGDRPVLNAEFVSERRGNLYEDRAGKLWFSGDEIYTIEEREDGQFSFNPVKLNIPKTSASTPLQILEIRQAADDSFWITTTWGLVRYRLSGQGVFYSTESARPDSLSMTLEDSAGRIWVARSSGVYVIKPEPAAELEVKESNPQSQITNQEMIVRSLDELAVSQMDKQPHLPENPGEIFKLAGVEGLNKIWGKSLYQSTDNHIWISTLDGVVEYDGRSFRYLTAAQGITVSGGEMIEDVGGGLWIGGTVGLQRFDRGGLVSLGAADGLKNPRAMMINETADGRIYIADMEFYINLFDGKRFESVRPPLPLEVQPRWGSSPAYLDCRNNWWFLTNEKLYRFAATEDFTALGRQKPVREYDSRDGLPGNQMFRIYENRHGDIWISVRGGIGTGKNGLAKWNPSDDTFQNFSSAAGNFPPDKSPSAFAEDTDGNLWLGFYEGGLARLANGHLSEISGDDVPKGVITALHTDKKGRLWIASALSGVSRLDDLTDPENLKFVSYTIANGLSSNNVRSITEDDFGQIYIGTARGIDRLAPDSGQIKHYTTNDGLAGDFINIAFRALDGALWFAAPNGVSRLVPKPEMKRDAPSVWLSGLRVAGESRAVSELGTSEISNLELAAAQNNLQIDFFAINFRASESLRYQFRLEGADADWSKPTEQRSVNYANLSAGSYRFLVRAVGSDGTTSPQPASISFTIARPVWQRWWFLLSAVFLISLAIYTLYRYRVAQLLKLERVRTRIATDLHDDIGASLSKISILSEIVNHQIAPIVSKNTEVEKSLTEISGTSREMVDSMSDIVWAINPQRDSLSDLTGRMRNLASEMCELADINLKFHSSGLEAESNLPLGADLRRDIYLIFKETINNLVKHSGCERAEIEFRIAGDEFVWTVKDDGKGFVVPKNGNGNGATRGGNGLINMRRRAKNLGGEYKIESNPGRGTIATLRVPLKNNLRRLKRFWSK